MKAFIYDMDGVICDTEPVHIEAEQRMLKKLGVTVSLEALYDYQGSSDLNLWTDLAAKHHLSQRPEALVKAKAYLFNRLMHEQGVTPITGVLSLIKRTDALRAEGLRTAIASSSSLDFIEFVTASLDIRDCFDTLQSGAELPQSKPDPAIYLKTAAVLQVAPADCVVIEDTENGARAAKAAGMYCIGFRSPHSGDQDLAMTDWIVSDMAEVVEKISCKFPEGLV